jgi:hypothetical protein
MSKIKDNYIESKNYSDDIMKDITKVLDGKSIKYTTKSNGTEVIISDQSQTKDSIQTIFYNNLSIPKMVIMVLVDVVEVDNVIYIRQKTK